MEIRMVKNRCYFDILFVLLFSAQNIYAQKTDTLIDIKSKADIKLIDLLKLLETKNSVHFSYNPSDLPLEQKKTFQPGKFKLSQVLQLMGTNWSIDFQRRSNLIILQKRKKPKVISGTITDDATGELLNGALVSANDWKSVATTNVYGFFSLELPGDEKQQIQFNFIGYKTLSLTVQLRADTSVRIKMEVESMTLKEVTVTSSNDNEHSINAGHYRMPAYRIRDIPSFAGESDALKALQFMSGVQTSNEGTINLSVRGGSHDQNLYLLDEAPVYNPGHAMNFFSVFNSDALQQIDFYKGPIPVRYGGRLSSVVDVRMKEGNRLTRAISGSIGTLASRLTVEGPLRKSDNRFSYIASARYSYAGYVVNMPNLFKGLKNDIYFYDLNGKINYWQDKRNHYYLSAYMGRDKFFYPALTDGYQMLWGNSTLSFRWNHVHSSKLFSNTTGLFSHYDYAYDILNDSRYFRWKAKMEELVVKQDYDLYPSPQHHVCFGFSSNLHLIQPGSVVPRTSYAVYVPYALPDQRAVENSLYVGNEQQIGPKFSASYGLRYSNILVLGPGTFYQFESSKSRPSDSTVYSRSSIVQTYHRLEPRVWVSWGIPKSSFVLAYDRTNQFMHLLSNSTLGLPTDVWMPSSKNIKPQISDNYSFSYQATGKSNSQLLMALYYKRMNNVLDFKDNANLFLNKYVESQVLQGKGVSYGFEFQFSKKSERIDWLLSYTLSKTQLTIEGINDGQPYYPRYDKRHNLSTTFTWHMTKRWELSSNFQFVSGGAMTLPLGSFYFNGATFTYYGGRNQFRLPNYHRMDISLRYSQRRNDFRKWKGTWSLDIYNAYAKKNLFTLYAQPSKYYVDHTEISMLYLLLMVPTIAYRFTF